MIGIVTVLYNSSPVLPDFFRSLDRQTYRDFTLYVVDNASPDDSADLVRIWIKKVHFRVKIIKSDTNGGIARGNNLGIRAARADGCAYTLLSNNDTVWPADTLAGLIENAIRIRAEIVVPKILIHGTGKIWYAGGSWNRWRGGTRHGRYGKPDRQDTEPARTVEYAPTCCMLIRSDVFERTGGMDERFFVYYDDSDFVRRAAAAGIRIWYLPQVKTEHKESLSIGNCSPFAQYWLSRNLILFTRKHFNPGYRWYVIGVNLLILLGKRTFTFSREQWSASFRGYIDALSPRKEKHPGAKVEAVCTD